ncbi:hypothetical protein SYNPS1DRAFT_28530 [Syncephalis pseudoplumigaleata]|uniref:Uncharacterized protein n=1 Tax=Syncephalis pseudoplumigaleata TaxID=1712513 RepID=A0A4P9Z0E0_9FUNG|nr:hypothetical protein SYNPS1DRAFT_28530 [Syncephalis pseudoplumigaleata]|eukprot:RKP25748.1 hypothetical protein SYNPS1DRAFT_28530 [Syncephalis pseudoplumigaleata]
MREKGLTDRSLMLLPWQSNKLRGHMGYMALGNKIQLPTAWFRGSRTVIRKERGRTQATPYGKHSVTFIINASTEANESENEGSSSSNNLHNTAPFLRDAAIKEWSPEPRWTQSHRPTNEPQYRPRGPGSTSDWEDLSKWPVTNQRDTQISVVGAPEANYRNCECVTVGSTVPNL